MMNDKANKERHLFFFCQDWGIGPPIFFVGGSTNLQSSGRARSKMFKKFNCTGEKLPLSLPTKQPRGGQKKGATWIGQIISYGVLMPSVLYISKPTKQRGLMCLYSTVVILP